MRCNVKLYDADDGEFMGCCCLPHGHHRGKKASAHKINYEMSAEGGEMDANKALVEARWEWVACWDPNDDFEFGHDEWIVAVADKTCSPSTEEQFCAGSKSQAWAAAAEFTREREEEIRQLREEIGWMRRASYAGDECFGDTFEYDPNENREITITQCRTCRILSRLEAILADKLRGWKEPQP